jgi:hypothetical protein
MSVNPRLSLAFAVTLGLVGCGSSSPSGPVGGDVPDASDQHCIVNGVMTMQEVGMCLPVGAGEPDAGADADTDDGGTAAPTSDYGPTNYNAKAYDDDCKYLVQWTSTPIRKNEPVTFTVTVTGLAPAGPITGDGVDAVEAYTNVGVHVSPSLDTMFKSKGGGVYTVGPIIFDQSGSWTVRFHMFEICSDVP